jgi:secondary thiamine-phosphate synthase enzyme
MDARSERPMSRLISCVRPPMRPLTDSRSLRVCVARGSIEYSAVTQPRPDPLRQRGTPSVTLAAQSTRVRPNSTSTEPSAWSSQWRVIVTGRSSSAARPSGRVTRATVMIPAMRSELRSVRTGGVPAVVDLTDECAAFVRGEGDGLLHVFVPHATAGIAILETGSGSDDDLLAQLDVLLPRDDRWRHRHGSAGHGRDHVVPAFVPPQTSVPVLEGLLQLGTWQRICLVDTNTDNPQRHVRFSFLAG